MSIKCISKNCLFPDTDHENCHFIDCCDFAVEQPTNADRIRAMNDEELAENMSDWQCWGGGLDPKDWLEWLQQTAE